MVDLDEMEAAQQLRQRLRALSARTQASIARSREIANAAWVRIRASRRRIFAHLAIAGGSAARDDMPADALHAQHLIAVAPAEAVGGRLARVRDLPAAAQIEITLDPQLGDRRAHV